MEKLLITGAGGLIGSAISRQLANDKRYQIFAVTSGRKPVCFPDGVCTETANLLDPKDQENLLDRVKPDKIIHLAWSLDGPGFLDSVKNIEWLEASFSLLRAFDGKSFLFAGSSSEYGSGEYCKETDPCYPESLYGQCKLAFSNVAQTYCQSTGVQFIDTRFFSVYGPGDKRAGRALPTAIKSLLANEEFVCKAPNNRWDYIFTEDIGKAISALLANETFSGMVNISTGHAVTMQEVFSTLARIMHKENLLSFENKDVPGKQLVGNNELLIMLTNMEHFTDLEQGLTETVRWWMSTK